MDVNKQKLLIEYLLSSSDVYSICQKIIKPIYFDPELRLPVTFIKKYFEEYNTTPDFEQLNAECNIELKEHKLTPDKIEYCIHEIEGFCKQKAIEHALIQSTELMQNHDYPSIEQVIKDAVTLSLNRSLGLPYFETVEERLQHMLNADPVTSTGWQSVDELLFGGIARKEMILFSGSSGAGKSVTLSNLGYNFLHQKLDVLYISLELSEDIVGQRFDTMFTGISRKDWKEHIPQIVATLNQKKKQLGKLTIVRMPSGTCANDMIAYMKEYYLAHDRYPDLLIVDYLDKMNPNEKNVSVGDLWSKDKLCAEQLRDMGEQYNMFIATASQLNRCLDPFTIIKTVEGYDILLKDVQIGDKLLSYDPLNHKFTKVQVTAKCTTYHNSYYIITLSNKNTVICSGNHRFIVSDGYELSIDAGLKEGYQLITNKHNVTYSTKIVKIEKRNEHRTLIDIETTGNHLFFANNILTHNSAVGATEHNHSQIAGGISKINETDVYISIDANDAMKAMGEIKFNFQKTRNSDGVGKSVTLKWDSKRLLITDMNTAPAIDMSNYTAATHEPEDELLSLIEQQTG